LFAKSARSAGALFLGALSPAFLPLPNPGGRKRHGLLAQSSELYWQKLRWRRQQVSGALLSECLTFWLGFVSAASRKLLNYMQNEFLACYVLYAYCLVLQAHRLDHNKVRMK
jgi:hypothetical protein